VELLHILACDENVPSSPRLLAFVTLSIVILAGTLFKERAVKAAEKEEEFSPLLHTMKT
jgi:hypothetical protein